jgi:carotenoid cleavage dioxygenase-like enzyme
MPRLHEWRFNMKSGAVKERYLDDEASEFPRIPHSVQGHASRFGYALGGDPDSGGMGEHMTFRFTSPQAANVSRSA